MLNVTGKYVTVFNPAIKNSISDKVIFATLSSYKKSVIDGKISYENMSWQGKFVAGAFEKAKLLKNFDKINILKGSIINKYDKNKNSLYVEVTIFDFVMSEMKNEREGKCNDINI